MTYPKFLHLWQSKSADWFPLIKSFRCFGVETGMAGCAIADVVTNNVRQSECTYLIQASVLIAFEIFLQVSDARDGQT